MIDLDLLEAKAKHQLQGPCTGMAHDVLELIAEIRKLRAELRHVKHVRSSYADAAAKGYPCDDCEIHCEYEGEPMTSCWLERVAYPNKW